MKTVLVNLEINLEDDPSDNVVSNEELEEMLTSLKEYVNDDFPFVVESVSGSIKVKS